MNEARFHWRVTLLGAFALASFTVVLCMDPIPQSASYHAFADQRTMGGIPHLLNVVSNLPFLVIGGVGLYNLLVRRKSRFHHEWERTPWAVIHASILLTGIGSCYYHAAPEDLTLFWDRLPLTLTFSAFLGLMILDCISATWGRRLFFPLLAAGAGSLLYWRWGASFGRGDLRWYGLLQGWAMTGVPLIFLLFPSRYTGTRDLAIIVLLYGIAKGCEFLDAPIFAAGQIVSGHTLKHLAAGLAAWRIVRMLETRRPRTPAESGRERFENLVASLD